MRNCNTTTEQETIQPFPSRNTLARNSNLPLPELYSRLNGENGRAFSYIASTVEFNCDTTTFEQTGVSPNFQGGVLTLCCCKHQMRSRRSCEDWHGDWLAGFTSRTLLNGKHWLFYLAQIEKAHESHADLWLASRDEVRVAKAADVHYLGDIYKPKRPVPTNNARFNPRRYVTPTCHAHRWRDGTGWYNAWHNDVNYYRAHQCGHPPLLVANPKLTFLWEEPMHFFDSNHVRDYKKWGSVGELFERLLTG